MRTAQRFFVTGTDTEIGKTRITAGLLEKAARVGLQSLGIKPVASGSDMTIDGLRNEDALAHQAASSYPCPYDIINPFCFAPAIAPHIVAEQEKVILTVATITEALKPALSEPADFVLVEGAGGWHTPLNQTECYSDWVKAAGLPVIVVVGVKLGAINHALLTVESIERAGLTVAGWVANCVDADMPYQQENLDYLMAHMPAPCLGVVPFLQSDESAADYLSLPLDA
ncbi:dethiobiotin synthase [Wohlfahrtiimonas chitiniclastica]|uniref:ATP-dependent dethiobiotin synthetase BioD n=1 Tax=Wohlfahrtiimonas chitiniclastica SH04 TaxID=1261130 RepID=L8XXW2_9GAMM|nr:dethiobiotin synthase [Wohlfahrtiimonas chitiniclastica]ELV07585.1 ATP-dependent dethiobiotin synthetase BioD 1 [Wohlfahrtiimonas chitiniclastica SH04]MBS7818612.1 dethiobiotin synthase [Wohlfahrtiimonas chitiniclastica]MBS7826760.1 dethiobiotin synthase [Wohlfahrtiimonas chitiniclastica]OYQ88308.1 dethiobiotin synthase [Wohlfahrtiimonas chitiniclastica]OYQ88732.1 dethiobiotin synthase [Wohlfahrtiimonas chitiniclastica]